MYEQRRSPREKRSVPERGHPGAKHPKKSPILRIGRGVSKTALWTVGIIVGLVVLLFIASFFVDEPMRRAMERSMNQKLTGYSVTLPKLHFRLIGLSVTLHDLTIRQKENPEPPVAFIPRLHASLHWREIFSGHLVSDFFFDHPKIHINLPQLQKEARDPTPIKDKGWQEAALAIYPFQINILRVNEGDFVYIDKDPSEPLHVSHLNFRASNIRNIHSRDHAYPSPIHADGVIFDEGKGVVDGNADFLAEPFAGVHVLQGREGPARGFPLAPGALGGMSIKGGVLASEGDSETPREGTRPRQDLSIDGLHLDFLHTTRPLPRKTPSSGTSRRPRGRRATTPTSS